MRKWVEIFHITLIYICVTSASPLTTTSTIYTSSAITSAITSADQSINYTLNTHPLGSVSYQQSNHTSLCIGQQSDREEEGRRTTPPYKRLIASVLNQLDNITQTPSLDSRRRQITSLEKEVLEKNDQLLPGKILHELCQVLTVLSEATTISESVEQLISSFNASTANVLGSYNYTAHRLKSSDEQRLLTALLTNYEKDVRPVLKASEPVELSIGLTLNQIDVDEKNQVLTVLVWLDQEWTDEKLIWDPANYSGLEVLRVPCQLLWLPDIVLYNSVEDLREGYMQALAMVSFDGNVFWPPIVKYRGNCEIDIKFFPYDDQKCKLKLGSWAYDGFQVNMTKRKDGIDLSNYQSNGEWLLHRTQTIRNVAVYNCCPVPYIDITFYIYLSRRTLYYVYNIIIPCIMLSILTLLSFWMKPDSGEKVNLGLTILLAFSVFMLLIAESMPSTSLSVPIIGIYITSSMCLTAFSVVSAVFVANINHQAQSDTVVPYWIHKFTHMLGRLLCVKMVSWEERHCNIRKLAMMALGPRPTGNSKKEKRKSIEMKAERNGSVKNEDKMEGLNDDDPLLKRLHTIVEHQEELLKKQNSSDDWHAVATIIDRCLFWVYLIMMASTTVGCIFIFPTTKDLDEGEGSLPEPL